MKDTEPSPETLLKENQELWDARVPYHVKSSWYPVEEFLQGEVVLDPIERGLLGDVRGKKILHLQSHFGLGSLSLVRLGAEVTAVDFSGTATEEGRALAAKAGLTANFVQADVQTLRLNQTFDVIFTSWGVLMWLSSLSGWSESIFAHMHAGTKFILLDFHPFVWIWDNQPQEMKFIPVQPYLRASPLTTVNPPSYTQDTPSGELKQHQWIHPVSRVITSLAAAGLHIEEVQEYPVLWWKPFHFMECHQWKGFWSIPGDPIPLSFSVTASKPR